MPENIQPAIPQGSAAEAEKLFESLQTRPNLCMSRAVMPPEVSALYPTRVADVSATRRVVLRSVGLG